MTFALGAGSLAELKGVHPDLVAVVKRAILLTKQDFAVHDGLRTPTEQKRLVASGASQTNASKHLIQADGFGHAVDLVPYINGKLRWEWPAIYPIIAAMNEALLDENAARKGKAAPVKIRAGAFWGQLDSIPASPESARHAVERYVDARRKAGRSAFIDGPHFELG